MDIDRFSLHDGPGIRAAIFLKGCPLTCMWCHSPESQKNFPETIYTKDSGDIVNSMRNSPDRAVAKSTNARFFAGFAATGGTDFELNHYTTKTCGEWKNAEDIFAIIKQDKPFYENSGGGITLTGGEILMQPNFSKELLSLCVEEKIHTAIETCGYGNKHELLEIARLCDLIYYDIKLLDDDLHKKYTGVSNKLILDNIIALRPFYQKVVIRTPCIPGINDSFEQIAGIAEMARDNGITAMEALPYNPAASGKYEWVKREYQLKGLEPRPKEYYKKLDEILWKTLQYNSDTVQ